MRAPRRSFANPFVITLAAIPVAVACNPPPPHSQVTVQPHPQPQPQPQPEPPTTVVMENPPRPTPPPPAPVPATDPSWHVTKKGGACQAFDNNACRIPPGQPAPPCNPPPPRAANCPEPLAEGAGVTVTQLAGQAECVVLPAMPKCPPNISCNPPPPRKVTCPF
ncbi:MAG: hypothetical protein KIT31_32195 [Deltaproteobacteria bacterium]|nr:hypothetical protein [Deltaproteobacteria bacterium]